jgi:hypothetical protein
VFFRVKAAFLVLWCLSAVAAHSDISWLWRIDARAVAATNEEPKYDLMAFEVEGQGSLSDRWDVAVQTPFHTMMKGRGRDMHFGLAHATLKGKRYLFCITSCKGEFDKDPTKYTGGGSTQSWPVLRCCVSLDAHTSGAVVLSHLPRTWARHHINCARPVLPCEPRLW